MVAKIAAPHHLPQRLCAGERDDVDVPALLVRVGVIRGELHVALALGIESVVHPDTHVLPGVELAPPLAHDDVPRDHVLPPELLHPEVFGLGVAPVLGGPSLLLGRPAKQAQVRARRSGTPRGKRRAPGRAWWPERPSASPTLGGRWGACAGGAFAPSPEEHREPRETLRPYSLPGNTRQRAEEAARDGPRRLRKRPRHRGQPHA
mmetsp:Transcript_49160/g.157466  ORF Transcript_49160/g.157466 Transcript_49160/m.157466 type:complete len:205 (+) Transcript_49160:533-1147(+)